MFSLRVKSTQIWLQTLNYDDQALEGRMNADAILYVLDAYFNLVFHKIKWLREAKDSNQQTRKTSSDLSK